MRGLRELESMSALVPKRAGPQWCAALALLAFLALGSASSFAAEPAPRESDWKAIKEIISAQRAALIAGDGDKAFGYATPALRLQFGDADTFLAMVHLGYPALLTARYTEFLDTLNAMRRLEGLRSVVVLGD